MHSVAGEHSTYFRLGFLVRVQREQEGLVRLIDFGFFFTLTVHDEYECGNNFLFFLPYVFIKQLKRLRFLFCS